MVATKTKQKIFDDRVEIVLVGNRHVGKTSLLFQLGIGKFPKRYKRTKGVDSMSVIITTHDDKKVQVKLWDTSGDLKSAKSLARCLYPQASGFIVMYDVTNIQSYNDVYHWMEMLEKYSPNNAKVIIVGNKKDLRVESEVECERHLTKEDGLNAASSYEVQFMEISAYTGRNCHKTIRSMVTKISSPWLRRISNNNNNEEREEEMRRRVEEDESWNKCINELWEVVLR